MANAAKQFFAGLPTDMEVRALKEAFGVPTEGERIEYERIEPVIRCRYGTGRFRTVTNRWRNHLIREHNIWMGAKEKAFVALAPSDRIDRGALYLRTGARAFRKGYVITEATDRARLTEAEKQQADHVLRVTATAIQAARLTARRVTPTLPANVGE